MMPIRDSSPLLQSVTATIAISPLSPLSPVRVDVAPLRLLKDGIRDNSSSGYSEDMGPRVDRNVLYRKSFT